MNKAQLRAVASQTHKYSFIESIVNVGVGLGINILAQHYVFPMFGIFIPWHVNLEIALVFTVISILRSFGLRRVFNWLHVRVNVGKHA